MRMLNLVDDFQRIPPPCGSPRQIGTTPGDFQRRKRDSEKISRDENEKIILYDDVSKGCEP